jgi:hypothetical protein
MEDWYTVKTRQIKENGAGGFFYKYQTLLKGD